MNETETLEPWYCDDEPETAIVAETLVLMLVEGNEYVEQREPEARQAALN